MFFTMFFHFTTTGLSHVVYFFLLQNLRKTFLTRKQILSNYVKKESCKFTVQQIFKAKQRTAKEFHQVSPTIYTDY